MLNSECLDAKEVLDHLHSLGYHNITPHQLKEFIHDLKKLIKYDQKHGSRMSKSSECGQSSFEFDNGSDKSTSDESYDDSSVSECSSSCGYKRHVDLKLGSLNKRSVDYDKVPSSFIRPWHLPVYNNLSSRSKKNLDPVRLYHQYKETWNKVNIPGESKHSQLRWVIRNKMLGQEPNPRVVI